jgi:hypothetical protein
VKAGACPRAIDTDRAGTPRSLVTSRRLGGAWRHEPVFQRVKQAVVGLDELSVIVAMISTTLSVHLLTVLQVKGLTLVAAVGLGALVGPSQIAARVVEMVIARYHHPIWTKVASTSLVATGLAALWIGAQTHARGRRPPGRGPTILGQNWRLRRATVRTVVGPRDASPRRREPWRSCASRTRYARLVAGYPY